MKRNSVLLFLLIVLNCGQSSISDSEFTVQNVVNGNTIRLKNGYTVSLLGVPDCTESKQVLSELVGKKVRFKLDKSMPRIKFAKQNPDKHFYAYAKQKRKAVNGEIIRKIRNVELHPYLQDSLKAYLLYAGVNKNPSEPKEQSDNNKSDKEEIIPAYLPDGTAEYDQRFSINCHDNLELLDNVCDIRSPVTRDFAVQLAKREAGTFNIGQICEIYDYLYKQWKYVNDPKGHEYLAKASESIIGTGLAGDCDDFAVVMYSVITAIGGKARINFAWNSSSGHAFTEVYIGEFNDKKIIREIQLKYPQYDIRELWHSNSWLNLDWTAAYPGGKYYNFTEIQTYFVDDLTNKWTCQ